MSNKLLISQIEKILVEIRQASEKLKLDDEATILAELEATMAKADFWSDTEAAESISRQAGQLKRHLDDWKDITDEAETLLGIAQIATDEDAEHLTNQYKQLEIKFNTRMVDLLFNGEYDNNTAIIQISAGVGGTDAQDWAQMLLDMYVKYANSHELSVTVIDTSYGEEAGIKSATIEITGHHAYGLLKSEKGVHRLVRLSPFNADSLRQTSFALVDVIPEITQEKIELDEKDLKIDTFRAGGHGGQSVNTTDSAVRITHLPTGLVVSIQNERSQLKNKQKALSILLSRLAILAQEQHLDNIAELRGKQKSADWGAQIRSYVLHPYTMVKDHRTDFQTADTSAVLGGKLDGFIETYLKSQIESKPIE